jgi:hypothetical protein
VQICWLSATEACFSIGGEDSLGFVLLPAGGRHLLEKNVEMLCFLPLLFSAHFKGGRVV